MNSVERRGVLAACVLLLGGCTDWEDEVRLYSPVWSDDGSAIAYVHHEFEFRPNLIVNGGDVRGERYQVRLRDGMLGGDEAAGPYWDGEALTLYWMRTGGYVLVGGESETFRVLDQGGGLLRAIEPRDDAICSGKLGEWQRIHAIPSVDGSMLAVVETRADCTVTVQFYDDPPSFAPGASYSLPLSDFGAVAWTRTAGLLVESCDGFCGETYWLVDPATGAETLPAADYSACFFTSTGSGPVDALGQEVYVDFDDELALRPVTSGPDAAGITEDYYLPGCQQLDG